VTVIAAGFQGVCDYMRALEGLTGTRDQRVYIYPKRMAAKKVMRTGSKNISKCKNGIDKY
jgi:hypothetical protein